MILSVGERIMALRKERNMSQIQLARAMDVSRQAVSKWENDLTAPDTIRLIQLADVLNTDVEYLATGNHTTRNAPPQIVPVYRNVDRVVEVEKIVEKPVYVEKLVEVEKIVETPVEVPKIKKVIRTRYLRNPLEYVLVGGICFIIGILVGLLL